MSEYNIKSALKQIEETDYKKTLRKLYETKWESLKGERNRFTKMAKTRDFLLQKGYESELIKEIMKSE